jgi:hypothetical protein
MGAAKELTEKLKGMGYKNFEIHEAKKLQLGLWTADITIRGNRDKVNIDLYAVTEKFTKIDE